MKINFFSHNHFLYIFAKLLIFFIWKIYFFSIVNIIANKKTHSNMSELWLLDDFKNKYCDKIIAILNLLFIL